MILLRPQLRSAFAGVLLAWVSLAPLACRAPEGGVHVIVEGPLRSGIDFDRLSVSAHLEDGDEALATETIEGEALGSLPISVNFISGPRTPAGTRVRVSATAEKAGRVVASAAENVALTPGAGSEVTLRLGEHSQSTDAGAVDAGTADAGTADAGTADAGADAGAGDGGSSDAGVDGGSDGGAGTDGGPDGGPDAGADAGTGGDAGCSSGGASCPQPVFVFAVNSGGPSYTSTAGLQYQGDLLSGMGDIYVTDAGISGTADPVLYQSERFGNFGYALPVPNGTYRVTLQFAEIYRTASGTRVFDVALEGVWVITGLDLYAEVGANTAYDVVHTVDVTDGELNLELRTVVNNAKLSAFKVEFLP